MSGGTPIADPVFTSSPPAAAQEGVAWSYTVAANDPSGGSVSYALKTSPSGAALSGATVTWTPTHAESRTASNFVITASTSEGGTTNQSFSITPNGTIRATQVDHNVTGTGIVMVPHDLSHASIEALAPDDKGGFTTITGSGDSNGNITIPNVPAGNYWLRMPVIPIIGGGPGPHVYSFVWTNASDLDLGTLRQGRPDSALLTSAVTINPNVNLTVTPQSNDLIEWLSPDAGPIIAVETVASTSPFTTPISQIGGVLIDSTEGDRAYLVHYTSTMDATSSIGTMAEFLEDDSLVETSGGSVSLTGTMTPGTPIAAHPVLNFSQFDALIPAGFGGGPFGRRFEINDPLYNGSEGLAGGINVFSQAFLSATGDIDDGNISLRLVDPAATPAITFFDEGLRNYTVNGTQLLLASMGTLLHTAIMPSPSSPLVPPIAPPTSVTIDGKDFLSDQTGISATPTIGWSAPTIGTADFYLVSIFDLGPPSSTTGLVTQSFGFYTTETSFVVPPGLIQPGDQFILAIAANASPGATFATAPFRHTSEYTRASLGSGLMTAAGSASSAPRRGMPLPKARTVLLTLGDDGSWTATAH